WHVAGADGEKSQSRRERQRRTNPYSAAIGLGDGCVNRGPVLRSRRTKLRLLAAYAPRTLVWAWPCGGHWIQHRRSTKVNRGISPRCRSTIHSSGRFLETSVHGERTLIDFRTVLISQCASSRWKYEVRNSKSEIRSKFEIRILKNPGPIQFGFHSALGF